MEVAKVEVLNNLKKNDPAKRVFKVILSFLCEKIVGIKSCYPKLRGDFKELRMPEKLYKNQRLAPSQ